DPHVLVCCARRPSPTRLPRDRAADSDRAPGRRLSTICGKLRSMRLVILMLAAFLATPSAFSAQTSDGGIGAALSPSMAASLNNMHMTIRRDLIESAEAMPPAAFSFK